MEKTMETAGKGRLWARRMLLVAVCAVLAFGLLGCRSSHKLEKVRYTSSADEVDAGQEQIDQDEDGRLEEFLHNVQQEEALSEVDEEFIAAYLASAENSGAAADATYDAMGANSQATDQASSGLAGTGDVIEGATGDITDQPTDNTVQGPYGDTASGSGEGEGSSPGGPGPAPEVPDEEEPDEEEVLPTPVPRPDVSTGTFTDESGNDLQVPVRVRNAAAVGPAAQLVEMIAGPGRLKAADAELLSNGVAQRVFSDIGSVQALWSGDGSSPISSSNLAYILGDESIGVVFGISGQNSVTQEQVQQMAEYGLTYVSLYPFDSVNHLKLNAKLVAKVMARNDYDTDSTDMANRYCNWVDSTVNDAKSRTSAMSRFTAYIAGWDSSVTYKLAAGGGFFAPEDPDTLFGTSGGCGSGLAYGYTAKASQMFSAMGEAANVHNTTTYYGIGHTPATDYVYVAPVFQNYRIVGGGQLRVDGPWDFSDKPTAPGYSEFLYVDYTNGGKLELGESDFPAIVVASNSVANKIASDAFWTYRGYGGIGKDFHIYVNPSGMGNWAEGSVESPLEAVWLANRICGQYSTSEVKSKVSDFYYQFYGVRLGTDAVGALLGM